MPQTPGRFDKDDSAFRLRLADQCHQKAEKDGRRDAARRGGDAAGQGAQHSVLRHRLFRALSQQVPKAGQRDGGPGSGPVHQGLVQPHRAENDSGGDIAHQDLGGSQHGFVDEDLADDAQDPAA